LPVAQPVGAVDDDILACLEAAIENGELALRERDLYRLKTDKQLSFGERRMLDTARTLIVKEIAISRDQTEEQVKASGRAYKVGTFPFAASGRARAMEAAQGFAKIVSAKDDDEVLGIHVIGPMAGELISEAVLAMEYSASTEDIQRTIHAHPTLSEAIHEAALAVDKKAIDGINR